MPDTAAIPDYTILLPLHSNFYANFLDDINPATFSFMSKEQKAKLRNQLNQAYVFCYQQQPRTKALNTAMEACTFYIDSLNGNYPNPADAPVKYQGLPIGIDLGKKVNTFTDALQEGLGTLHQARRYWGMASGLATSVLSVLPRDTFYNNQTQNLFAHQQQPYGYLSWVIAYARFALNIYFLITEPWLRKKKNNETYWTHFQAEWQQRKFMLFDTFLAGTVNLVCFFWVTGTAALQYTASFINMAALCCDLGLILWMRAHQTALYNKQQQALQNAINEINSPLAQLDPTKQQELKKLTTIQSNLKKEWDYTSTKINYGIMATVGTMLGFFVLFGLLCPPAILPVAATLALTITGLAIGLACSLIFQYKSEQLDRQKTQDRINDKNELLNNKLMAWYVLEKFCRDDRLTVEEAEILELVSQEHGPLIVADQQKILYLEIQALKADTIEQQRIFEYQRNRHLFSVLTKIVVPIIVTTSLLFAPLGIGLPILSVVICGLLLAQLILNNMKPKTKAEPRFDKDQYKQFSNHLLENLQVEVFGDPKTEKLRDRYEQFRKASLKEEQTADKNTRSQSSDAPSRDDDYDEYSDTDSSSPLIPR